MSGYTYLASPYSHPDPHVRLSRYRDACLGAARLMRMGDVVFAPICHSHPVETIGIGQTMSGEFWKRQDIPLLRHASKLVVLRLEGWEESKGIAWEIELAQSLNIPVEFIDP